MKIKTIKQTKNLKNKIVLLRVDYNVAIKGGKVLDTQRLERSYSTINYLLKNKAKVVLISHLGRPGGKKNKKFSLKPVVKYLNKITKKNVFFINDCIGEKVQNKIAQLKAGQILLLENVRFYPGEEKNDPKFAQELASLGDIFVNDAFAMCHRKHASVSAVENYLPAYAGFNLLDEIENLSKVLKGYKRPAVAIIGGAKISTKIKVIENLAKKYDYILIGGALANNFFAAQKINIGMSKYEEDYVKLAAQLYKKYKNKIILPIDVKITNSVLKNAKPVNMSVIELNNIKQKQWLIADIGPKTEIFYEHLIQQAKTLIYNGAMGIFEIKNFSHGTYFITEKVAMKSLDDTFSVVGGGETLVALHNIGMKKYPDFVSTAGGAMLEFLEGKILPGIKPLIKK